MGYLQKFFVLYFSEDGDVSLEVMTRAELQKYLDDQLEYHDEGGTPKFLSKIDARGVEYTVGTMIIKGDVIIPKPTEVVKKFSVE